MLRGNFGWAREAIYQPWFSNENKERVASHRANLEKYFAMYQAHGMKVMLAILACNPADKRNAPYTEGFFDWVAAMVRKYPCIRVVEMHNEPNLRFFWHGSTQDYVDVYRQGAGKVKAARSDVQVVIGSISSLWYGPGVDWLKKVIRLGGAEFADGISVHPYNKTLAPEVDPHYKDVPRRDPDHLEKAILAWWKTIGEGLPEGRSMKLYFTEFGWSSGREGMASVGSEQKQADYLSRLMLIYQQVRLSGIPLEAVFWYDLKNDRDDPDGGEANFGLISYDTSRLKPAYVAYQRIAAFFDDPDALQILPGVVQSSNLPTAVKSYRWQRKADGALVVPFWRMEQHQTVDRDFSTVLSISLPEGFAPARIQLYDLHEDAPRPIAFSEANAAIEVPVTVSRRAAWLVICPKE
jgi:hypothetical protein